MKHYLLIKETITILLLVFSTILGIISVDYQDLKDELKENIEYYGENERTTFKNKLILKKMKRYKKIILFLIIILIFNKIATFLMNFLFFLRNIYLIFHYI